MKHTMARFIKLLCGMAVMLALVAGITDVPVLAASNGIYIATATPHYKHPTTGTVEDAGGDGSAVLGQSMTESATYKQALVEVDPEGNTYITVRLQLMDNIQNPQFQVDGKAVSASVMQEDYSNNTADYRMKVNSETSIIRCNMYVIAMGREVIFYITVSDLKAGSGDFITSVKVVEQTTEPDTEETTTKQPDTEETTTKQPDTEETTEQPAETTTTETQTAEELTTEEVTTTQPDTTDSEKESSTVKEDTMEEADKGTDKDTGAKGLEEYDAAGNRVESSKGTTDDSSDKKNGGIAGYVIGGVAVVAVAGFGVWYFCFFKKKK